MTLKDHIEAELARLASSPKTGRRAGRVSVQTAAGRLESELIELDAIGCAFQSFVLTTDRLAGASVDRLRAVCDALASRLTYLLEPIALIESDAEQCVVQMRSNPPHKEDDAINYYELVVRRGGQLRLCRYAKRPGAARQIIPARVTREVFCRLAADFDAALCPPANAPAKAVQPQLGGQRAVPTTSPSHRQ